MEQTHTTGFWSSTGRGREAPRLVDSLLALVAGSSGDALVMRVGHRPCVIGQSRHVDLSTRVMTEEMLDKLAEEILPPEVERRLRDQGRAEHEMTLGEGARTERFLVIAVRDGEDDRVELRRARSSQNGQSPGALPGGTMEPGAGTESPGPAAEATAEQGARWRHEMGSLKESVRRIAQIDGVTTAAVVARDGFLIEGQSSDGRLDAEAVGAVISTGIGSSEVMGNELGAGEMAQALIEFRSGSILIAPLGTDAILAVVTGPDVNIGNVRFQLKRRIPEIEETLQS